MDIEVRAVRSELKLRSSPRGLYMFDRRTGLNVLLDEVRIPAAQWAYAPRYVSVALTNACDLACPYCYAPKSRAALDPARLSQWLRELDENGCLGIGFGGGEPTLHRQFVEICRHTAAQTRLAVTFTTHAHRITDAHLDKLRSSVHYVRVSVDGIGATYESLRGRAFDELRARLATIRKLSPFGINFVVNERTLPDLDFAIELGNEFGATEFLLLPEQPVKDRGGIDPVTLNALREWLSRYRGKMPLAISGGYSESVPCDQTNCERGLRAYAHIDAKGVLKRSSFDNDGVLIGPSGVMKALGRLEGFPPAKGQDE